MSWDTIILGAGGVGSAAAYHLARRGEQKVLALEQFGPAHNRGSSHGETRIIRKAYFEHPNYVPLLERAYTLWKEMQAEHGTQLYFPTGLIEVGPPNGMIVPNVIRAAEEHRLPLDRISRRDFGRDYPALTFPEEHVAVFEREAGFLRVEDCVGAHLELAEQHGAEMKFNEPVIEWKATARGVVVKTAKDTYEAANLVITAGAWAADLMAGLGVPLRILQKYLHWFEADSQSAIDRGFPCFFFETNTKTYFYGFPNLPGSGLKVAEHGGGFEIEGPAAADREAPDAELPRIEDFLKHHIAGIGKPVRQASCFYSMSPDEHFIIDRHPEHRRVCFAAGLSGHGFKFASVLGEAMATLASDEELPAEFDFLSIDRF